MNLQPLTEGMTSSQDYTAALTTVTGQFDWVFNVPASLPLILDDEGPWLASEVRTAANASGEAFRLAAKGWRVPADQDPLLESKASCVVLGGTDPETAIATVAVQLAGGVAVPLETRLSEEYARRVVRQLRPAAIMTRSSRSTFATSLAAESHPPIPVIEIDPIIETTRAAFLNGEMADTGPMASPTGAAILLFSSGSTAEPKGIVKTFGSLMRMGASAGGIRPKDGDVVAMVQSTGYIGGASTPLKSWSEGFALTYYDVAKSGLGGFADWINRHHISYLRAPAALFRSLLDAPILRSTQVRVVHTSGETIHPIDIARFRKTFPPGCDLRLVYGSSESNAGGEFELLGADPVPETVRYSVHRTAVLRFVDAEGNDLQGPGTGEILMSRPGMAPGYWMQPELTKSRFFEVDKRRWYRTGDLGEQFEDGTFAVIGRIDDRLKIRGNNADPSDAERALTALPDVRQAAVVGVDRPGGGTQLAAFVVSSKWPDPSPGQLRAQLRASGLPEHLIPSRFVFTEALPHGGTGKVDRRLLKQRFLEMPFSVNPEVKPETELEKLVFRHVSELLGADRFGIDDDLIDLGCDSLMMVELERRLFHESLRPVSMAQLVAEPNVRQIARRASDPSLQNVVQRSGNRSDTALIPLATSSRGCDTIILFPGAGSSPLYLRRIGSLLREFGDVYGAQGTTPGSDTGDDNRSGSQKQRTSVELRGFHSIDEVAQVAALQIRALNRGKGGRLILMGHSWGGALAAATAANLGKLGTTTDLVVLFDSLLPKTRGPVAPPPQGPIPVLKSIVRPSVSRIRRALAHKQELDGLAEVRLTQEALHRAHLNSLQGYTPVPVPAPALYVAAAGSRMAGSPELATDSWDSVFSTITMVETPGTHRDFLADPYVVQTARTVAEALRTSPA